MPPRDKVQPFVGRACMKIAQDVASKMKHDTAKIGNAQNRNLDIGELIDPRSMIRVVEVSVFAIVDHLIGMVGS